MTIPNHEMEYDRSVVGRCRLCWLAAGACVGVSEGVRAWTLSAEQRVLCVSLV